MNTSAQVLKFAVLILAFFRIFLKMFSLNDCLKACVHPAVLVQRICRLPYPVVYLVSL